VQIVVVARGEIMGGSGRRLKRWFRRSRVFCRKLPTRPLAPAAVRAYPLATMTAFLVVLHVLVSLFLILFVLLQPGSRGGVGAAFGGAGGQTVFGGRGANTFLAKLTAAAAVIFMITSITLSFFGSSSSSVMAGRAKPAAAATDAKPADAAVPAEAAAPAAAAPAAPAAPAEAAAPAAPAAP
jgi:preprotein translocase subunit SecG